MKNENNICNGKEKERQKMKKITWRKMKKRGEKKEKKKGKP